MEFYMLVLALDTTTRRGSAALRRDGILIDCEVGDPALTHGQRLPGDLIRLLDRQDVVLGDIDLFAIAAGPGSFTGLRVGIAAMQGLALVNRRPLAGVSALDALNAAVGGNGVRPRSDFVTGSDPVTAALTGVWMDAQRGEVFSALYRGDQILDGPCVHTPDNTLLRWSAHSTDGEGESILFVGDGALAYAELIRRGLPHATVCADVPPLAPFVAQLAEAQGGSRESFSPGALRPIYLRRPDAELARDRRKAAK